MDKKKKECYNYYATYDTYNKISIFIRHKVYAN